MEEKTGLNLEPKPDSKPEKDFKLVLEISLYDKEDGNQIPGPSGISELSEGIKAGKDTGEYMSLTEEIRDSAVIYSPRYFERGIRYKKEDEKYSLFLPLPASPEEIRRYFTLASGLFSGVSEDRIKSFKTEGFSKETLTDFLRESKKSNNRGEDSLNLSKLTEEGLEKSHEAFKALKETDREYVEIMMARWPFYAHRNDYEMLFESETGFLNIIRAIQHDPKLYYMAPAFRDGKMYYVTTEKIKTLAPASIGGAESDGNPVEAVFVFNVPGKGMVSMNYNEFINKLRPGEYSPYDLFRILIPEISLETVLEIMDR